MLPVLIAVFVQTAYAEVDVRFDNTLEYDYACPWDFAEKHNWTPAPSECEPDLTGNCATLTCVSDDSAWSGFSNCSCGREVPTPRKLSRLNAMRRAWNQSATELFKKPLNTASGSPQLVVLDHKELWQVDPYSGGRRRIGNGSMVKLATDFALWYDRKVIILPRFVYGVQMCNITKGNWTGSLSLGCQCDYPCSSDTFERLDSTETPYDFRVALDWTHGTYYWAGHNVNHGAVGVYDVVAKRRRVLFSGYTNHIQPTGIEVDPIEGFLFWFDSARHAIVRTDTDGRNLIEIVKMPYYACVTTLDIKERRIYWLTTAPYYAIASTDYDGDDARLALQSCHFVRAYWSSLAVLDDRVFWTSGDALLSVANNGSERVPRIHYVAKTDIRSVKIWHGPSQPEGQNKCSDHRCAWMCLPRSSDAVRSAKNSSVAEDLLSYNCVCSLGQRSVWRDEKNFCVDDTRVREGIVVPL